MGASLGASASVNETQHSPTTFGLDGIPCSSPPGRQVPSFPSWCSRSDLLVTAVAGETMLLIHLVEHSGSGDVHTAL